MIGLLRKYRGRVSKVIQELKVSRGSFYYFMKKNGIEVKKYRSVMG